MPKSKETITSSDDSDSSGEKPTKRKHRREKEEKALSSDESDSSGGKTNKRKHKREKEEKAQSGDESDSSGDKATKKKHRRDKDKEEKAQPNKKSKKSSKEDETEPSWELSKNRSIKIRKFHGKLLIDIRETYVDDKGEQKPGKKGIALDMSQWQKLMDCIEEVDKVAKAKC